MLFHVPLENVLTSAFLYCWCQCAGGAWCVVEKAALVSSPESRLVLLALSLCGISQSSAGRTDSPGNFIQNEKGKKEKALLSSSVGIAQQARCIFPVEARCDPS